MVVSEPHHDNAFTERKIRPLRAEHMDMYILSKDTNVASAETA
jgi:hypothetical protein